MDSVANIMVRNIDDADYDALRVIAAQQRMSISALIRQLIRQAVSGHA